MEVEDAARFMQNLYRDRWSEMYEWENNNKTYDIMPSERDPQLLNGTLLARLGRSTLFDVLQQGAGSAFAHEIEYGGNYCVAMPRKVGLPLPTLESATRCFKILCTSGQELRALLLETGILRQLTDEEERALGVASLFERNRSTSKKRGKDFDLFRKSLGITDDGRCKEPVFALAPYLTCFVDVVYVLRDHPSGVSDSWPYLRCTCEAFSKYGPCEHVEYARTLKIPNMRDAPNSADNIDVIPSTRGRRRGTYTTASGKAAAAKKVAKMSHPIGEREVIEPNNNKN